MKIKIAALLVLALLSGCDRRSSADSGDGAAYIADLEQIIRASDRIVVTEHSSRYDEPALDVDAAHVPVELVYRQVILTKEQRQKLLGMVEDLNPRVVDAAAACVFEPHHRIDFSTGGNSIGSMEICFKCGDVHLSGSTHLPPEALIDALDGFVATIGMQSKQDWEQLAKDHRR